MFFIGQNWKYVHVTYSFDGFSYLKFDLSLHQGDNARKYILYWKQMIK